VVEECPNAVAIGGLVGDRQLGDGAVQDVKYVIMRT
jgi:hypothetical protein